MPERSEAPEVCRLLQTKDSRNERPLSYIKQTQQKVGLRGAEPSVAGSSCCSGKSEPRLLVVFCGPPACGKTSLAKWLVRGRGGELIRSDAIRAGAGIKGGDEEGRGDVYEAMFCSARQKLLEKKTVVLDATFYSEMLRSRARAMARDAGARFALVCVTCSFEVALDRNSRRAENKLPFDSIKNEYLRFERPASPDVFIDTSDGHFDVAWIRLKNFFERVTSKI